MNPEHINNKDDTLAQSSAPVQLFDIGGKPVFLDFEGGMMSSDVGALLLRDVENQTGLVKAMTQAIKDLRDSRYIKHTVFDLFLQRITKIACGNEDANDCDTLRNDPIFKMIVNRKPETGEALSSQPTMSRFENSIS